MGGVYGRRRKKVSTSPTLMPRITNKKTGHQELLEQLYGMPIEDVIRDVLRRKPRREAAAAELRISASTLEAWKKHFGISDPPAEVAA